MAQGAPKGNQFWKLRSKHGRDKLFATPELLLEAAQEYFQWCDDNPWNKMEAIKTGDRTGDLIEIPISRPYTLSGLCVYLGVNSVYFQQFRNRLNEKPEEERTQMDKDFANILHAVEEIMRTQKFEGAAVGAFNANIIARDLGLAERNEHSGKDGAPINIAGNITHNINFKDCDGSGSND